MTDRAFALIIAGLEWYWSVTELAIFYVVLVVAALVYVIGEWWNPTEPFPEMRRDYWYD